jgi:hypothetical protein
MPHDDDFDPDYEGPSDADLDRFGDDDDDRCPACGASVYHDLTSCPRCGADLDAPRSPAGRLPAWLVASAVALVIVGLIAITLL